MSDKPDTPHPEEDPTLHRNPASGVPADESSDPAFLVWEMLTSIGPVTGTGTLLQWGNGINTSGGVLDFYDGSSSATFAATIPAPGVMALLGVAGFVGRRRRC